MINMAETLMPLALPVLLGGLLMLPACQPVPTGVLELEPPAIILPATVQELAPAEAADWLTKHPDAVVVDLRMPEEITREGRLSGSKNYDALQTKTAEALNELDRQKPLFLYCALGGRARETAATLHAKGFQQMALLKGGLNAWLKEGRPVIK